MTAPTTTTFWPPTNVKKWLKFARIIETLWEGWWVAIKAGPVSHNFCRMTANYSILNQLTWPTTFMMSCLQRSCTLWRTDVDPDQWGEKVTKSCMHFDMHQWPESGVVCVTVSSSVETQRQQVVPLPKNHVVMHPIDSCLQQQGSKLLVFGSWVGIWVDFLMKSLPIEQSAAILLFPLREMGDRDWTHYPNV